MYLLVYKLKDLKLRNEKFEHKSPAIKQYKRLLSGKNKVISISLYSQKELIQWSGDGSHFNSNQNKMSN